MDNDNNVANMNDSAAGIRIGIGSYIFQIRGSVSIDRAMMAYLLWAVYVVAASWVITRLLYSPLAAPGNPMAMLAFVGILLATTFTATVLPHPHDEFPQADSNGATGFTDFEFV